MEYGLNGPADSRYFSLFHRVQTGPETHPAYYSMGTRAPSMGVKRLGSEAGISSPRGAEAKNGVIYTRRLYPLLLFVISGNLISIITAFSATGKLISR
jgi:hypothetical protein